MTIQAHIETAEACLSDAFEQQGISSSIWLRDAIYGTGELHEETRAILQKQKSEIQDILGWARTVPSDMVARLVATCLGRDLLRSSEVRKLLAGYQCTVNDASARMAEIMGLDTDENGVGAILTTVRELEWRPSTRIARELTEAFGLPLFFSEAGTSDQRPMMEVISPIRALPPLLDFQRIVHDKAVETLLESGKALIVMPTGAGKTRTCVDAVVEYFQQMQLPLSGIIWMADREELCEQAFQTLKDVVRYRTTSSTKLWRFWSGNKAEISEEDGMLVVPGIVVSSIQQMQDRLRLADPVAKQLVKSCRVLVIDEAHRNLDWTEALFLEFKRLGVQPGVLGLTATPFRRERHESGRLGQAFNFNAIAPVEGGESDQDKIAKGLTAEKILATRIDLSANDLGVSISYGGNEKDELRDALNVTNRLIGLGAKSILVFANSVQQSKSLATALRLNGITSNHLDSSTSTVERQAIIDGFREGDVHVLVNFGILTTGFDAPNTDAVAIFRNTEDSDQPVIQQMIGRGLRGPRFGGTDSCFIFIRGES